MRCSRSHRSRPVSPSLCVDLTSHMQARWSWLGRIAFAPAVRLQEDLREGICAGSVPETLLLCEHEPVITLGRSADARHVLATPALLTARGVVLEQASRGGDVTYHGPGQLVGYPIFRLRRGVVAHVESMAEAIITVLRAFGITGVFRREQPGVWVGDAKICAFGVHVRRRVAIHGFALNIAPNLADFGLIVPCGLRGQPVTSVAELLGRHYDVEPWVTPIAEAISAAFERSLVHVPPGLVAGFASTTVE